MNKDNRERLSIRVSPETKEKIQLWQSMDNCKSMNQFVEKAVNYYTDQLAMNGNDELPKAFISALDGRLSLLEKNISTLAFDHAVLLDMLTGIIADAFEVDRADLNRRRKESINNVKGTNGRISFEKKAQERWEDYDQWQD